MQVLRPQHHIDKRFKYFVVGSLVLHTVILFWIFFYQVFVPHLEISTITINLGAGGGASPKKAYVKKYQVARKQQSKMVIPEKQLTYKTQAREAIQQTTSTISTPSTYGSMQSGTSTGSGESGTGSGGGNGAGSGGGEGIVSSNQLDNPPALITFKNPVYPVEARKQGIEGVVVLKVLISPDGRIRDVKILKSIPIFDESAVQAVKQWRFTPITSHGNPVYVWMIIPIRFQLK
ncbi:MAG: energy transducer TonB [bacterium]